MQGFEDRLPSLSWSLNDQDLAIMSWMSGGDAKDWCARCCHRYGLPPDMSGDVLSATWIRLRRALDRRVEPFEDISTVDSAARYAARACENTAIDFSRSARRHTETVEPMDDDTEGGSALDSLPLAESRISLEELRRVVVGIARDGAPCGGCSDDVVLASALWIINAQILGDPGSLSDLLYDSLMAIDPMFPPDRGEAARQRKSRCGRCVVLLLKRAIETMEGGV